MDNPRRSVRDLHLRVWYADITLAALLSFTPPIPAFHFGDSASIVPSFTARREQSAALRATRWFLKQRPDSIPAQHGLSSPSIVVVIGILEHITGKPIVDVIREEVFAPLDLRATFVPRGQYGPNQPRGHFQSDDTLRYPWHDRLAGPGPYFEASQLAISLPDYVSFLQAHLCAALGRPNVLLTHAEALRMCGDTESIDATPLGWMSLNSPRDPIRIVELQRAGFSGFGGFSTLTGRGALRLMNMQGLYATYAFGWVLAELFGYDLGETPKNRGEIPR